MAEHYFMSVDGKKDFLVFNGNEQLTNEEILDSDIEFIEIQKLDEIKSMAWSSNCKWTFVIQKDCIYLINTYKDLAVRCKKKSSKFFEMFLNKKGVTK
uniref:Uncharacterized protein n=1 Tax=viral metagenome TaxID=1070528 RepID=A0A6H2A6E9_9ZZZZ